MHMLLTLQVCIFGLTTTDTLPSSSYPAKVRRHANAANVPRACLKCLVLLNVKG